MKQKDIILYASIAGGAYLAYWYVTNYGPTGEAGIDSSGARVPSYWDLWFGSGVTTRTPATGSPQSPQPNQQTAFQTPSPPILTAKPDPPREALTLHSRMIEASTGNAFMDDQGRLNADQWNYYLNQVTGFFITGDQFNTAFPVRTDMLTLEQFLSAAKAVGTTGLGAIVSVPSAPSIPSMTFGGSLRNPGMRGNLLTMGSQMKGPVN